MLTDSIKEYRELLNQLDEDITPDFPLLMLLELHDERYVPPKAAASSTTEAEPESSEKSEDSEAAESKSDTPTESDASE